MKSKDLTILFLSCDKYSDLWEPLLFCFRKYWPDCPYPVRLASNTISFKDKKIHTILSGPDKDWSSSLKVILKQIDTPYVFLWLDDIFLINTIESRRFGETLKFIMRHRAKHVHVEPKPAPDKIIENGKFGVYMRRAPYRVTAFGFWDVNTLIDILIPGETPWSFEIMGSYRSAYMDGFYCTMSSLIHRIHVVEKGSIFRDAYDYCITHAIPISTKRYVLSDTSHIISELKKYYFNGMIKVPWSIRVTVMNILRKLFISY